MNLRLPVILCILLMTLFSCNRPETGTVAEAVEVFPNTGNSEVDEHQEAETVRSLDESMIPKINIPGGYDCFDIRTENLDLDRADEQILLCRESDTGRIELWIIDYDNIKDINFISYKHGIESTELRRFQILTEDLIGDHIPEILCFGADTDGTQTLNVFRKSTHPTGIGLYYTSIFQEEIKGTIEVMRKIRDQGYREGISNGKSFSIETYIQDETSGNYNDLIRSSYFFRYQTNSYVLVDTEKISGDRVDEEKLKLLYTKGVEEYKSFLDGAWFKTDQKTVSGNPILVMFNMRNNRITYYEEGSQEILIWTSSSKPLYNKLVVTGINELIPDLMRRILTVSAVDINSIYIFGSEPWRGSYSRFTEGLQKQYFASNDSSYEAPDLNGIYVSPEGATLYFSKNRFILNTEDGEEKGGYAFYVKGNPIIAFKVISERGILIEDRVYKYDFFEETKENKIIRTLVLYPGKMSIRGFVPTIDSYTQYQQIETVETEEP